MTLERPFECMLVSAVSDVDGDFVENIGSNAIDGFCTIIGSFSGWPNAFVVSQDSGMDVAGKFELDV